MQSRIIILILCCFSWLLLPNALEANDDLERQPQTFSPPESVSITLYRLDSEGAQIPPGILCEPGDNFFGCTADPVFGGYPYATNPITVTLDTDYLLDVVSQEMKPTFGFSTTALKAQAVAARSFVFFFDEFGLNITNDTESNQAFLPYAFEALRSPTLKTQVEQAVNIERYISYNYTVSGETLPIRAEYSSDIRLMTEDCDDAQGNPIPYHRAVDEPISSHPSVITFGNPCGMSQKGASRWAYGNLGFSNNLADWSTSFGRFEQILAHYYTGMHLRTTDSATAIRTSEYRWNPLEFSWSPTHTFQSGFLRLTPNTNYSGVMTVQNTSADVDGWECNALTDYRLVYTFSRQNTDVEVGSESVCDIARGKSAAIPFSITTPNQEGAYSLRFDIHIRFNGTTIQRFSEDDSNGNSWNRYGIAAIVGSANEDSVFLPTITGGLTGGATLIPTSVGLESVSSDSATLPDAIHIIILMLLAKIMILTVVIMRNQFDRAV